MKFGSFFAPYAFDQRMILAHIRDKDVRQVSPSFGSGEQLADTLRYLRTLARRRTLRITGRAMRRPSEASLYPRPAPVNPLVICGLAVHMSKNILLPKEQSKQQEQLS